jgi:uncharacterized protein (TIRG00374 family)
LRLTGKQWAQVILSLLVAVAIFWYLYKDIKPESLTEALRQASVFWILLSIAISIWGYWLRAWRWKLLIEAEDATPVKTVGVFWALMTGYLVNLLIPRAGEVARCGVLKRTNDLQMGKLLGTVILERTVDLLFLIGIIFLVFLTENSIFLALLGDLVSLETLQHAVTDYLPLLFGTMVTVGILAYWGFNRYRERGMIKKIRHFFRDFLKGLRSVGYLKNQWGFWSSSAMIWFIYFIMMYWVAQAMPSTDSLTASSVLMVMVMGSIGMIAPVQGGIGTFHALVAYILLFYGLEEEEGKIFAVIIHSTQMLTVIALGIMSLIVFLKIQTKEEP